MSVAYFIVPQKEVPGLDCFIDGKSLAHVRDDVIKKICDEAGVRPWTDFMSSSAEELAEFLDEEDLASLGEDFAKEQWFTATDGLKTVRALIAQTSLLESAADKSYRKGIKSDLKEFEKVLIALKEAKVRWHMSVDI
jgi:hypothetical protein